VHLTSLLAAFLLAGAPAFQPAPTAPPAAVDPVPSAADLVARLRAAYRSGPLAERVGLRAVGPDGRERAATVTLRLDAGEPGSRPARVRLDLGRLLVGVDGTRLVVVNTRDPAHYYEATLQGAVTAGDLRAHLPDVPLPQLDWAFPASAEAPEFWPLAGEIRWEGVSSAARGRQILCAGATGAGPLELTADVATGRLVQLAAAIGPPARPTRISISVRPLEPGDPAAWLPSIEGRLRVDSVSRLRPRESDLAIGSRLPGLSLMDDALDAWSLTAALAEAAGPADAPIPAPIYGALLLYDTTIPGAQVDASAVARDLAELSRELDRRRTFGEGGLPRLVVRPVGAIDLARISAASVAEAGARWESPDPSSGGSLAVGFPRPVWTPAGRTMLDALAPGSSAVLVVVDAEQKLALVLSLDSRADDAPTVVADVRSALEGWSIRDR